MTLPDYNFLSAPLWLVTVLHVLTLTLHFAAMNFMLGGAVLVLFGRFPDRWQDPTVRLFLKLFPTAMAATISLGVAPLLFLQLVYPRQAYSAAIVSGWLWLMVVPAVILAYYCFYAAAFSAGKLDSRPGRTLLLALIGLVYVSLVYSSVFSMAERPDLIRQLYAQHQGGQIFNPEVGDYLWRWAHMMLGAITVGGFCIGALGRENPVAYAVGKRSFLWGFILASVAGLAYLFSLGQHLAPFMRTPAVWSLFVGILLGLGAMHLFLTRKFWVSGAMLLLSLGSMVINRHFVRLLRLEGQFDPGSWKVQIQWSPFVLFLICFVLCIGLVWYMLSLFFAQKQ